MSKTAQRKRDAYNKGYRVGRYGKWDAEEYRFSVGVGPEFERGRRNGERDRRMLDRKPGRVERFLTWLTGKLAR
jgi:hypothetical protein